MALPRGLLVLLSMAGVVVAVAGLRSASGIVGPAFLALTIAITIHPLLAWLQRRRVPGWLAVVLTMLVAYVSLVALAAALVFSVARLATLLPSYQPQFTSLVDQFTSWLGERGVTVLRTTLHPAVEQRLQAAFTEPAPQPGSTSPSPQLRSDRPRVPPLDDAGDVRR